MIMKKSRGKKYSQKAKAVSNFNGLVLEWESIDPFGNASHDGAVVNPKMSHKNPVINIMVNRMFGGTGEHIFRHPYLWLVNVSVVFCGADGKERYEGFSFKTDGAIAMRDISEACSDHIADIIGSIDGDLVKCVFKCECLGEKRKKLTLTEEIALELCA